MAKQWTNHKMTSDYILSFDKMFFIITGLGHFYWYIEKKKIPPMKQALEWTIVRELPTPVVCLYLFIVIFCIKQRQNLNTIPIWREIKVEYSTMMSRIHCFQRVPLMDSFQWRKYPSTETSGFQAGYCMSKFPILQPK